MQPAESTFSAMVQMWVRAVVRAFHPARWGLCLLALSASFLVGALALIVFEGNAWHAGAWWNDPSEAIFSWGRQLFGKGSGTAVFRSAVLAFVLSFLWSLVAGWIARSELLSRRPPREASDNPDPGRLTASAFVRTKVRTLIALLPVILIFAAFFCIPGWIAGWVNRIFPIGIGATLISIALPLLLICSLLVLVLLLGGLSYSIMPAALAAEGSDSFDAISRGYSYLLQRPVRFAWYSGWSLVFSSIPFVAVLALLDAQAPLLGPVVKWLAAAGGTALSLSLFWTLQTFVYLKMRRLIDNTPEDELWDESSEAKIAKTTANQDTARPDHRTPDFEPRHTTVSVADTQRMVRAFRPPKLMGLLLGVCWTGLVLAGGALTAYWLTGTDLRPENLPTACRELAEQQPVVLLVLAAAMVLLGALGLGRSSKLVARMAASDVMFQERFPPSVVRAFVRSTRTRGMGSIVLFALGSELFLATSFLVYLAVEDHCSWQEVLVFGSIAAVFLTLGGFGLGAVAVEGEKKEELPGASTVFIRNLTESVASAALHAGIGLIKFVFLVALAWLGWLVTCEMLSWWGGAQVHWLRWGLDGALVPDSEGGLYQVACGIAGCWFFLFFALVWAYPLSYALSWGAVGYLRARQKMEELPALQFEPTPEERAWSEAEQRKRQELQRSAEEKKQKEANRLEEEKQPLNILPPDEPQVPKRG